MSLLKKAYRSDSFKEVTGRWFFFFKEVQLISNLHSETNHRKWLMQKGKEKEGRKEGGRDRGKEGGRKPETGFQLIYT